MSGRRIFKICTKYSAKAAFLKSFVTKMMTKITVNTKKSTDIKTNEEIQTQGHEFPGCVINMSSNREIIYKT